MLNLLKNIISMDKRVANPISTMQNYALGFAKYFNEFMIPSLLSAKYFADIEQSRLLKNSSPAEMVQSYMELMEFNLDISNRAFISGTKAMGDHWVQWSSEAMSAVFNTFFSENGDEKINDFINRQAKTMNLLAHVYPESIKKVESEFGFHFERGGNIRVAETERFILYQILPTDKSIAVREDCKPLLILPPFVLGANILAFLPYENKSYTHSFANQGIPTYIRIMKDINTTPAVQIMTGEDDAMDTRFFCEKIMSRHGKKVTLNGYCQGGYSAVCDLLSGELDDSADALITCVSPMDGTRSKGLNDFLKKLPLRFNDLAYGTKTIQNGNKVADGTLMGWIYKLKSIETESPMVTFLGNLNMAEKVAQNGGKFSKTACAINHWLQNERTDLPLAVTRMSFDSYTTPVSKDGTLPVKLFGRELNFKRLKEKGIKWLICYGEKDDLVEKETALAPLDYIDAEVSAFPKGHVAIATSWSDPKSAYALHTYFGDKPYRGPVRFQLDMDESYGKKMKYQ